jgi:hypothetical protein
MRGEFAHPPRSPQAAIGPPASGGTAYFVPLLAGGPHGRQAGRGGCANSPRIPSSQRRRFGTTLPRTGSDEPAAAFEFAGDRSSRTSSISLRSIGPPASGGTRGV